MTKFKDPSRDILLKEFVYEGHRLIRRDGTYQYLKSGPRRSRAMVSIPGYGQKSVSRALWIYLNGEIPEGLEVDHIDGNPLNNDPANLRLATSSQQKMNRKCQSNNRAGLKGAFYHSCRRGKKWRSQIKVNGKLIFLGYFATPEEASSANDAAAKKHFGEFHNDRIKRVGPYIPSSGLQDDRQG